MIKFSFVKLKQILKHKVAQNAIALYFARFSNIVFPLLTLPYLARVLGPEEWGAILFSQSFAIWISMIIEYGFSLSGTRDIAKNQGKYEELSRLAISINFAKILLTIVSGLLFYIFVEYLEIFNEYSMYKNWVFLWGFGLGMSQLWFFQGIENVKIPAMIEVFAKLISVAIVFLFVNDYNDGEIALASFSITCVLSSFFMTFIVIRKIELLKVDFMDVLDALKLGWNLFLYRGAVSFYTTANMIILGIFCSTSVVSYFGGAEKIAKGVLAFLGPTSQAFFPRMSVLIEENREKASSVIKKYLYIVFFVSTFLSLLIFSFSNQIINTMLGDGFDRAVIPLKILVFTLPFISIGNGLGLQWLVPMGFDSTFRKIIIYAGMINIFMASLLAYDFQEIGMSLSILISEAFVAFSVAYYLFKNKLSPWHYGIVNA